MIAIIIPLGAERNIPGQQIAFLPTVDSFENLQTLCSVCNIGKSDLV